ncbi:tyrosine-type recombinase/integrase [Streptomonospora algeriensis]|uniref:Tyrosine-type recombinase/integrase n=1 Tax=Streptomonospora algeriensis TaxID=995084 RepID=A0ABW3BAV3_9ACTN
MGRTQARHARHLTPPPSLSAHIESFVLYLRSIGRGQKTVSIYKEATQWFAAEYLATGGRPPVEDIDPEFTFDPVDDWERVQRKHVQGWCAHLFERGYSDSYVSNQYRALQAFFKWFADDEDVPNPMLGMTPPKVVDKPVPVLTEDEMGALFATVTGKDFRSRRDLAIMLMLRDTGIRLQELAGLQLEDVAVLEREATVTGKGRRTRTVKYSYEAARALDKYLRVRAKQPNAQMSAVWIGLKGAVTPSGIQQIVQRRAAEAGLGTLNPHKFRHYFSHTWLDRGGAEGDLMELNGWNSPMMLRRYGRSAAASRARRGYDRIMGEGQ